MLKVEPEINVNVGKNVPTKVSLAVKSEFDIPRVVTITTSCGCTTAIPNFTIEPFSTKIIDLTVTRPASGSVNISFVTNGKFYSTKLNISVN